MGEAFDRLRAALADSYTLERELGAGGMATVYLARDVRHNRNVAIKVMHPELALRIGAQRFLKEIETTANLQHPNILPLFDSGQVGGTVFYVMPYVQGESLRHRLNRETQLPVERRSGSPAKSRRGSTTPTATASSTGTSSRTTCCSTTGGRWWPTSGSRWPGPTARTAPG